jgi:hypothetical protein
MKAEKEAAAKGEPVAETKATEPEPDRSADAEESKED